MALAISGVTPSRALRRWYVSQYWRKRVSSSGFTISKSRPACRRSPARSMRALITAGRPTRIGLTRRSSSAICTARSTRSSSPSAYTTRLGDWRAALNSGRINMPVCDTKRLSDSTYASMSLIGRVATPEASAARATAGAMRRISRESNGVGIR